MSSRVQKGGTVFRPVGRPKTRITSSTPAPSDARSSTGLSDHRSATPAASMLPPAVPLRGNITPSSQDSLSSSIDSSSAPELTQSSQTYPLPTPPSSVATTAHEAVGRAGQELQIGLSRAAPIIVSRSTPVSIVEPSSNHSRTPPVPQAVLITSPNSDRQPIAPIALPTPTSSQTTLPTNTAIVVESTGARPKAAPSSHTEEAQVTAATDAESTSTSGTKKPRRNGNPKAKGKFKAQLSNKQNDREESDSENSAPKKRVRNNSEKKISKPNVEQSEQETSHGQEDHQPKRKLARKRQSDTEAPIDSGADSDSLSSPKRRRRSSSTPRTGRKSRVPEPPAFDADADPGDELDPTQVSMGELCEDLGIGRVSTRAAQIVANHAVWKQASRERRAQIAAAAEAKKYGRSDEENPSDMNKDGQDNAEVVPDNDMSGQSVWETIGGGSPAATDEGMIIEQDKEVDEDANMANDKEDVDVFDYSRSMGTSRYNVQVRIGPNGETIVDEQSLFVDRNEGEEDDMAGYTHVEESDMNKFVNSMSYSKKTRGSRWSAEETEMFFEALSQFGENYELISLILPGRDRKACKNKFKAEDKRNPNRITWCLNNRTPYDIATLSRLTGKDFSGPTPEIRVPTPPVYDVPVAQTGQQDTSKVKKVRKKSRSSAASDGEEILGTADTFVDDFE